MPPTRKDASKSDWDGKEDPCRHRLFRILSPRCTRSFSCSDYTERTTGTPEKHKTLDFSRVLFGGQGRIRTAVRKPEQIYSLPSIPVFSRFSRWVISKRSQVFLKRLPEERRSRRTIQALGKTEPPGNRGALKARGYGFGRAERYQKEGAQSDVFPSTRLHSRGGHCGCCRSRNDSCRLQFTGAVTRESIPRAVLARGLPLSFGGLLDDPEVTSSP